MQTQLKLIDMQVNQDEVQKKRFLEEKMTLESEIIRLKEEIRKIAFNLDEEKKRKTKNFEIFNEELPSPKRNFLPLTSEIDYYKRIKDLESQHQREILSNQTMYEGKSKKIEKRSQNFYLFKRGIEILENSDRHYNK
jgi:hypothetical protein